MTDEEKDRAREIRDGLNKILYYNGDEINDILREAPSHGNRVRSRQIIALGLYLTGAENERVFSAKSPRLAAGMEAEQFSGDYQSIARIYCGGEPIKYIPPQIDPQDIKEMSRTLKSILKALRFRG